MEGVTPSITTMTLIKITITPTQEGTNRTRICRSMNRLEATAMSELQEACFKATASNELEDAAVPIVSKQRQRANYGHGVETTRYT